MDSQLVSDSLPEDDSGSGEDSRPPSLTFSERFHEEFPRYLAMGMTEEQFWDKDPALCRDYREAERLRNDKRNEELWLQGMYVYDAIIKASPILHDFAKKGTKPDPYPESPYPITEKAIKREKIAKEKAMMEKGRRYMEMMAARAQIQHQ